MKNMKLLTLGILCLVLVGCVSVASGYICISADDNDGVAEFKARLNILGIQNDIIENNITKEAFLLKLKYFSPCK